MQDSMFGNRNQPDEDVELISVKEIDMKYEDGTIIIPSDILVIYPRRIVKHENYEIWQHPYIRENILEDGFDLQFIFFNIDGSVDSYHISDKEHRFKDLSHLGKLQLVYHDVTLEFYEYQHLVKDIWSDEPDKYFEKILKEKENK